MKKFTQDLLVTAIAGVTSLLTAIILVLIERTINFEIYGYMLWFVIPIGAIMSGMVAASGYYFGSKWFHHKPTRLILINMLLVSTLTFFLVYYLNYITLSVDGKLVSDYITYSQYLNFSLTHTSMGLCFRYHCSGQGIQLGSLGYVFGVLQILGFFGGGWFIYLSLGEEFYCDQCSRYYYSKGSQSRHFSDTETASRSYMETIALLRDEKYQEAIDKHASLGEAKGNKQFNIGSVLELKYCKQCQRNNIKLSLHRLIRNEWKSVKDTAVFVKTGSNINLNLHKSNK